MSPQNVDKTAINKADRHKSPENSPKTNVFHYNIKNTQNSSKSFNFGQSKVSETVSKDSIYEQVSQQDNIFKSKIHIDGREMGLNFDSMQESLDHKATEKQKIIDHK